MSTTLRPVLSREEHASRHPRNPWSTSEQRTFVLDETDTPGVLFCWRCGCQVVVEEEEGKS